VAFAFALAILVIGTQIALVVHALYDSLSWMVGLGGDMAALERMLVSIASTLGPATTSDRSHDSWAWTVSAISPRMAAGSVR
jgi:hypothetical protein